MPVKECQINGQKGYKWGDRGKCYVGRDAKQKAINQGIAIGEYQESYTDYPQAATENAKIALRWAEENGWGTCGTPVGKARANQLANREPISRDTIARMAAFERHRQNSNKELGDGCGRLMWQAWGGDEGIEWAQRKLKQIDGFNSHFNENRVSFDYDGVLSTKEGEELLTKALNEGKEVYIISRRSKLFGSAVYEIAKKFSISPDKVYLTDGELKWKTIKRLNIGTHYDNDLNEINALEENTLTEGILI